MVEQVSNKTSTDLLESDHSLMFSHLKFSCMTSRSAIELSLGVSVSRSNQKAKVKFGYTYQAIVVPASRNVLHDLAVSASTSREPQKLPM